MKGNIFYEEHLVDEFAAFYFGCEGHDRMCESYEDYVNKLDDEVLKGLYEARQLFETDGDREDVISKALVVHTFKSPHRVHVGRTTENWNIPIENRFTDHLWLVVAVLAISLLLCATFLKTQ